MADGAGADQSLLVERSTVSGSICSIRGSGGIGEEVEEAMDAGAGGKNASERAKGKEGNDRRIGGRAGSSVDRRKMRDEVKKRMDILRIAISLLDDIAFGKFLPLVFDSIEDIAGWRICQFEPQLNLNQFSTNSQPTKKLFCGII